MLGVTRVTGGQTITEGPITILNLFIAGTTENCFKTNLIELHMWAGLLGQFRPKTEIWSGRTQPRPKISHGMRKNKCQTMLR